MARERDERRHRAQVDAGDTHGLEVDELDRATTRRSQRGQAAEWRAAIEAGDAAPATVSVAPRYQDSDASAYLGEHWQLVRAEVTTVFERRAPQWLTPTLAWGAAPRAVATIAVDGLLPTLYFPGALERLVPSLDELVTGARAVGGTASRGWNAAVGRAIGRELEESVGRAMRTMAAIYARAGARSPRTALAPSTRFEQLAVELIEQGNVRVVRRPAPTPAAKPASTTPTLAEHEEVLGPAIDVGAVAPGSELTFEPSNPIPVGVDPADAQRSAARNASAAQGYAEVGGAGGGLAVDTARDRFDALDDGDATAIDVDARIDTFVLQLGTLSQNLHRTSDALFGSRETIGHVAGLSWVVRAEVLARSALAVDHTITEIRTRLTEQLRTVAGPVRQRLLADAQTELSSRVSQTRLVQISEQAIHQLREIEEAANTILAINAMVLSIAASLVAAEAGAAITSSLLTALARTSATGATLVAGQAGAFVVGQITEAAINAAFQSAVLGDDSSEAFAENLLGSLLAQGALRGTGHLNAAVRAADPSRAVRVGSAALELAVGAGTGLVAQAAVRGVDSDVDPALMGLSITLGHWLSRRIAVAKERVATRGGPRAAELQLQLDGLTLQNQRLLGAGDAVERTAVVELVREAHEVLRAVEHDGADIKPTTPPPNDVAPSDAGPTRARDGAVASPSVPTTSGLGDALSRASPEDVALIDRVVAQHGDDGARLVREYGNELLEYLRFNPLTTVKELEAALIRQRAQVKERVDGFFEGIDADRPPDGWEFKSTEHDDGPYARVIMTHVRGPNGAEGFFERAYDRKFNQLELRAAFLKVNGKDASLPNMVAKQPASVEMVEGRGSPTIQYVTLYQMKKLGVPRGDAGPSAINNIHMSSIQNVETIVHLHYLRTKVGGELAALVIHTASVKYAETTAVQTGYQRADLPLVSGGKTGPIGELLEFQERGDLSRIRENDQILAKYGFDRDTAMLWNFDIDMFVRPAT